MSKLLFIYNPHSGKAQIKSHLSEIIDIFVKSGADVTVRPTQRKFDAYEIVKKRAEEFDIIATSGGDGTLNETVAGLMKNKIRPKLLYIPSGTTNDFATSLNIPKVMEEAAELINDGKEFRCDIGSFWKRHFTYIAAFGAFTEVSYQTSQQYKNMMGHMAYVLSGIKSLTSIKKCHMKICFDDKQIEDDFIFGMVSNSMSVGGFKGKKELGIELDDGVFEVALVKMPGSALELQETINDILKLDVESKHIYFFRAACLKFKSKEKIAWTLDGEYGGKLHEVIIKNNNKAITILKKAE